ncbi:MAG: aminopeptidase P family protein [Burkholderiales bacterium]|nr:aminopeptidase P family protein [Burkholderiales bacterium]
MLLNQTRLQSLCAESSIDALVATAPENVTYSTGYWALSQWIRRGPQSFAVLPARDIAAACVLAPTSLLDQLADQEDVWVEDVRRFGFFHMDQADVELGPLDRELVRLNALPDRKDGIAALLSAIRDMGLERSSVGIDELGLMPGQWEQLVRELPHCKISPASELFRRIRAVKTPAEIERLSRVAVIAERSVAAALAIVEEGVTEMELARAFHTRTVQDDAFPVLGCIGFGTRSAMPNVHPSQAPLRRGDVIRFDVGGRYKHYRADIARIATFGEPDARVKTYHRALHNGVNAAFEVIRPGVTAAEVFKTAVEAAQRSGIPHYSRNHVGHGIGLDGYDVPNLAPGSKQVIEEGMVMCVETPYYELGWCGLQVENTVVVRADGPQLLHRTDGALQVLA